MDSRTFMAIAGLAVIPSCGGTAQSSDAEEWHDVAPQSFVVGLDRATTAADVIPQILKAGRPLLSAACADYPGASIRVFNPLASGAYTDVSCTSVLGGDGAIGEASAALVTNDKDEAIGEAQQRWSPFGLGCTIATGLAYLFASRVLCDYPKAERPKACHNVTDAGFFGLGVMCAFM